MKPTLIIVSLVAACQTLLSPSAALADRSDRPLDPEHKDFFEFLNDKEREHYWERRKQRLEEEERERIREDDERRDKPVDAPTPVDLKGPPTDASDKTTVNLDTSTRSIITEDTTVGDKQKSTGKVLGGIKFADDGGDDSDDARRGGPNTLKSPFSPILKDDEKPDDTKSEADSDKTASGIPRAMLDSVDADYFTDDKKRKQDMAWRRLTTVHYDLNDWVPGAPDPLANGGFGIEEGNGRPVPYHLNGHPDPERKLPWKTAD